jgi:hypothetical protein
MVSHWFHSKSLSLPCHDIFLCNICCRYSMLNGIVGSQKVRAQKAMTSPLSTGGVVLSLAARKTNSRLKGFRRVCGSLMKKCSSGMKSRGNRMKQCGSGMTSTLRPLLNIKLSFTLVDLTISFAIEHLAILSKLINCIATCIANGAAVRNLGPAVPTSHTTTSLQVC